VCEIVDSARQRYFNTPVSREGALEGTNTKTYSEAEA